MRIFSYSLLVLLSIWQGQYSYGNTIEVSYRQPVVPILTGKSHNPVLHIHLVRDTPEPYILKEIAVAFNGDIEIENIKSASLFHIGADNRIDTLQRFGSVQTPCKTTRFTDTLVVDKDTLHLIVSIELNPILNLKQTLNIQCISVLTNCKSVKIVAPTQQVDQRLGVALRQSMDDGVESFRIPGLSISKKGTLLAIYDIRRDSYRDLQGNMDIGLSRSMDGGVTWQPMQVVLDKGCWGGLPQKFNGVSDGSILVDENSGDIFIAGLWMYGLLDKESGRWVKGLTESSTEHNHQWKNRASQPGFGVKRTSQFLITKSSDDGLTWGEAINITRAKKRAWWLFAPAPGHGITMSDGTLVIPSQGRDKKGGTFSNITWSKDGGKSWKSTNAAYTDVTECMAVELSNGSLMLNMRDNRNRGRTNPNGRRVCTTTDLGATWTEHATSRKALIESTCMGSIHKHNYTKNGVQKSLLLFANPNSTHTRDHITIKMSFDDGATWHQQYWILLDQERGRGYSCITSIDNNTIGILYEGSQADMTFQQVDISAYLK